MESLCFIKVEQADNFEAQRGENMEADNTTQVSNGEILTISE